MPFRSEPGNRLSPTVRVEAAGVATRVPSDGWLVYACRTSYAPEVAEIIWRRGEQVAFLLDNLDSEREDTGAPGLAGIPVLRSNEIDGIQRSLPVVIPLLTPGYRCSVLAEARALGMTRFPPLVDPTAIVGRTASIGEGTVLNAGVVVAAQTALGRFVHVNRSASVGHDNVIDNFATLGPGCVLAGSVHIGTGAFVGAGAVCAPEVTVGANAVVGAGAVVIGDVPAGSVVVGNPAKVLREGPGYAGVGVPVTI